MLDRLNFVQWATQFIRVKIIKKKMPLLNKIVLFNLTNEYFCIAKSAAAAAATREIRFCFRGLKQFSSLCVTHSYTLAHTQQQQNKTENSKLKYQIMR